MVKIFSGYRTKQVFQTAIACVLGTLILFGCSAESVGEKSAATESAAEFTGGMPAKAATGDAVAGNKTPALAERKIIYTGQIDIKTENLDTACKELEKAVKSIKGYIGSSSRFGAEGTRRSASYSLRIPSTSYDTFMDGLQTIGELQSTSRKADDVSEEYYDSVARLNNKRVTEKRLIFLLENKTGKLADVLTVETELSRIREEIEQIEGRIRFLSNQTSFSTIDVTISEVKNYKENSTPVLGTKINRAFTNSLDGMKAVGENTLLFLVAFAPWAVLGGLLTFFVWMLRRPKRKKNQTEAQSIVEETKES